MATIFDPTFERYLTITPTGKNLRGFIYLKPIFPKLTINEQEVVNTTLERHKECMDIKLKTTRKGNYSWWVEISALTNNYTLSKTGEKLQVARTIAYNKDIGDVEYLLEKDIDKLLKEFF